MTEVETKSQPCDDEIVERIVAEHRKRAAHGLQKYGVKMTRDDLTLEQWLQHAKEEAMDFAIYLERIQLDLARRFEGR